MHRSEKDKERLIIERVMGLACFDDSDDYQAVFIADGVSYPVAFWIDGRECWGVFYEENGPPRSFRPLRSLDDAWKIMDSLSPGRAGDVSTESHEDFLVRARFVDALAYHMESWWSWTRERLCEEICKAALRAYGVEVEDP